MDYGRIKREIIEVLRGELTQLEFSHILGYNYNQTHKWEADLKKLRYSEFLDVCIKMDIDIHKIFSKFFLFSSPYSFSQLFNALRGSDDKEKVSEKLGVSLQRFDRWLKEESSPEIEVIFNLIDTYTENLTELVSEIVYPKRIKYLSEIEKKRISLKDLFTQFPMAPGVMGALSTIEYICSPLSNEEYFSSVFGCSVDQVHNVFKHLLKNEIIKEDPKLRGKYTRVRDRVDLNGLSYQEMLKIDIFWSERTLSKMKLSSQSDQLEPLHSYSAFRVAAMSEQAAVKIKELLAQTNDKIIQIIGSDVDPKDVVKVFTCHSINM